jgi:hypothetical protein
MSAPHFRRNHVRQGANANRGDDEMIEAKFTPGPWLLTIRAGRGEETKDVSVAEIEPDARPYRGDIARLQSCEHIEGIDGAEMAANAHLIAAAPDLYAALERIVFDWDGEPEDMVAAENALRKARGEA